LEAVEVFPIRRGTVGLGVLEVVRQDPLRLLRLQEQQTKDTQVVLEQVQLVVLAVVVAVVHQQLAYP
jgi:hypothetical protein